MVCIVLKHMNPYQEEIKKFCEERGWSQFHNPKDILLGIVEGVGELRNMANTYLGGHDGKYKK